MASSVSSITILQSSSLLNLSAELLEKILVEYSYEIGIVVVWRKSIRGHVMIVIHPVAYTCKRLQNQLFAARTKPVDRTLSVQEYNCLSYVLPGLCIHQERA